MKNIILVLLITACGISCKKKIIDIQAGKLPTNTLIHVLVQTNDYNTTLIIKDITTGKILYDYHDITTIKKAALLNNDTTNAWLGFEFNTNNYDSYSISTTTTDGSKTNYIKPSLKNIPIYNKLIVTQEGYYLKCDSISADVATNNYQIN
jgi:hypothetical protein